MRFASTSSTSVLLGQMSSSVTGSATSSCVTRPTSRFDNDSMSSSPSRRSSISMPLMVPQSGSLMTTSCTTSTRRRVRYPASAVLRAVSASPLRAPWVEMKYSSTERPSLKFDKMGFSMISPTAPVIFFWGFCISPRIPASCLIWSLLPRAPESSMRNTGLNPSLSFASDSRSASSTTSFKVRPDNAA